MVIGKIENVKKYQSWSNSNLTSFRLSYIIYIINISLYDYHNDIYSGIVSIDKFIKITNSYSDKNKEFNKLIPEIPKEMRAYSPGAPIGYGPIKNQNPKARNKSVEILRKIKNQEITFGYLEPFSDMIEGKEIKYIAKVEAHYDNHPKVKNNPDAEPYWHIGVSIYEKK